MAAYPEALQQVLDDFGWITARDERAEYLIQLADQFTGVPAHIAIRPYPEENHVTFCESDAYVFAEDQADGSLKYYFAVENPQGLSAMAMSVILDQSLSGQPLTQVVNVPDDIVLTIFGKNVSMGKGQGLMGIVSMARGFAQQRLKEQSV